MLEVASDALIRFFQLDGSCLGVCPDIEFQREQVEVQFGMCSFEFDSVVELAVTSDSSSSFSVLAMMLASRGAPLR